MMDNQAFDLLMDKLQGIDRRLEEGDKKFDQFHDTLEENTRQISRYSDCNDTIGQKIETIESDISKLNLHVQYMQKLGSIFCPTRKKIVWGISSISLFFGIVQLYEYLLVKQIL